MRGDSWIKVLLCGEVICLLLVVVAVRVAFSWFFACVFLALAAPLLFSIGIEHSLRAAWKKERLGKYPFEDPSWTHGGRGFYRLRYVVKLFAFFKTGYEYNKRIFPYVLALRLTSVLFGIHLILFIILVMKFRHLL